MSSQESEPSCNNIQKFRMSKALFFLAAFLSFVFSVFLYFKVDRMQGIFVGIWVPSILSAGSLLLTQDKGVK